MTDEEIRSKIDEAKSLLSDAITLRDQAECAIKNMQRQCPHRHIQTWTNDDGEGQFTVERCLICGLQCDGKIVQK